MNYLNKNIYIYIKMDEIIINCYFITNSLTCNDLINLINKKDIFSQMGLTSLPNPQDSFLSNIGLEQTNILSKNYEIKKILNNSDLVGTSILKSSIENALILYKNTNKNIFPLPFMSKNHNESKNKELRVLKKHFNKNISSKNSFSNDDFDLNKDKKFWNDVLNASKKRKNPYNDKLSDLKWSVINSAIKNKMNINYNPKKFMNLIYHRLLKKIYLKNKDEYNLTFFTNIQFIVDLLKIYKKKLDKETIINLRHNGVIHIEFKYNMLLKSNKFVNYDVIFPTKTNYNDYSIKDGEFYFEFNRKEYPLNIKKFNQNDILEHLLLRCDNFKNIVKKIKKK